MNSIDYNKEKVKEIYEQSYSIKTKSVKSIRDEHISTVIRFKNLCSKYKVNLSKLHTYIDIACGDGVKTNALSQFFEKSIGIDFSKNAIAAATKTFASDHLNFIELDILSEKLPEKFDVVTCFGNSTFNISDINKLGQEISLVADQFLQKKGALIIGSFTDYSGTAPTGWYNITSSELDRLSAAMNSNGKSCHIYFPYKHINNYFSGNWYYTLKEIQKLIFQKRRYFYLLIH